ncbi:hypothetical protein HUJ05_004789 [Dendroctonus ponderosae]|nr:hypothetical protein HUJ05_004789 [Dendroctonus ponderosae]
MMQIIRIALSLEAMQNEPKLVAGKCPHTEIQSCSNRRTDTNESALPEVSYNVQIIATFYEPLNVNIERLLKAQEKGQTRCFIEVQSSSRSKTPAASPRSNPRLNMQDQERDADYVFNLYAESNTEFSFKEN